MGSPTLTNTSSTTPGKCEPMEIFSVLVSTMPAPATVRLNGVRPGSTGGLTSGPFCCARTTCSTANVNSPSDSSGKRILRIGFSAIWDFHMLDTAVRQVDDAIAEVEDTAVVRDHDDGPPRLHGDVAQQLHDLAPRVTIESGGRLVADQQPRLMDQGPGEPHAPLP